MLEVDPAVMGGVAAGLVAEALKVSATAMATAPVVSLPVPPSIDDVSIRASASFAGQGIAAISMAQMYVGELLAAAEAVGGSAVAFQITDLANQGLLLV